MSIGNIQRLRIPSSPSPYIEGFQHYLEHISRKIWAVVIKIDNFVSKFFLEKMEYFFTYPKEKIRMILSHHYKVEWMAKNGSNSNYFPAFETSLQEKELLSQEFEMTPHFRDIQKFISIFQKAHSWNEIKPWLEALLEKGMCHGLALSALKHERYFPYEKPMIEDFFSHIKHEATFLQLIYHLWSPFSFIDDLNKLSLDLEVIAEKFFLPSGEMDEDKTFYYLRKAYPNKSRLHIRQRLEVYKRLVTRGDMKRSPEEMQALRQELSHFKTQYFLEEKQQDSLPFIPGSRMDEVLFCPGKDYSSKGQQELLHDYLLAHPGAYRVVISVLNHAAHTIFIKVFPSGCIVYDPHFRRQGKWFRYPNKSEGIKETLKMLEIAVLPLWCERVLFNLYTITY